MENIQIYFFKDKPVETTHDNVKIIGVEKVYKVSF